MNKPIKRNIRWLEDKLYEIWDDHFADVPMKNLVVIKFGRSSIRQLGSIKLANPHSRIRSLLKRKHTSEMYDAQDDKRISIITITKKFQDPSVPEFVIDTTIAHELCHYAHGFNSSLERAFRHPHQGGIIRKELESRGFGREYKSARQWLKENWKSFCG